MIKSTRAPERAIVPAAVKRLVPTVRWAGEYRLLRGENAEFSTALTRLGYVPSGFRVTVRRITGDGRKMIRYNVFVDQLRDGQPFRGKVYFGGEGENWIDQFVRDAPVDFPPPFAALSAKESA